MEAKLRAYLASVLFDLKLGKSLPVLKFQFHQLVKALVSECSVDKQIVESYLVSLFSLSVTTDNNDVITEALSK